MNDHDLILSKYEEMMKRGDGKLYLSFNNISDISVLRECDLSSLRGLYLSFNNISDIWILRDCNLSSLRIFYLNNNKIEEAVYSGGDLEYRYVYKFEGEQLKEKVIYGSGGEIESKFVFTYNGFGEIEKETEYTSDGEIVSRKKYEYTDARQYQVTLINQVMDELIEEKELLETRKSELSHFCFLTCQNPAVGSPGVISPTASRTGSVPMTVTCNNVPGPRSQ